MKLYLNRFKFDTSQEIGAACWANMRDTLIARGMHLTELPANSKRPTRAQYDLHPFGHCRLNEFGEEMFDFVVYRGERFKSGYVLELLASELDGGGRLADPLPAPPAVELERSRTALAVDWLIEHPNCTQADAAELFGITQAAVSAGVARSGNITGKSASRQAVDWLIEHPNCTQADAAELFGVERATVTQAMARHRARQ
ncbi:MAG: hypothetical protein WC736_14705 [Gallionella sp.]|jgi:predicted transcriptional regulator